MLIDLDPQGNASTGLGVERPARAVTSYELILGEAELDQAVVSTDIPRLAIVPASQDLAGAGYNAAQAKIAVGSGGMFGQGLFHGQLVAGNFVPSQQTDFIFTVAGEELGFVGTIVIVFLLGVVIVRALRIATRADDLFGLLVASGIAIWFTFQSFVNIGMTIGIMPITGLPLPFVSYGGSAIFADMIAIGLLQSVHRRHTVFD